MPITKNSPIRVMDFRSTYKGGGGPDKTILHSAAQHDPEKVDILVTYLRDPSDHEYSIDKWAQKLGIKYVDVPDARLVDFKCINMLKKIVDKHDIQLVHSHDDKTLLYGWMLKNIRSHLKIMYTCHSHPPYTRKDFSSLTNYLRFFLRSRIQIFLMQRYSKPILTIAFHTKRSLLNDGLREHDVEVLYNGIDTEQWQPSKGKPVLREELNLADGTFIIGTVARIAQQDKDLATFYRVASAVVSRVENVKFVIVGDGHGDLLDQAKKEVRELGLAEKLLFTGHRTDLLDIYASFDVFLMTSRSEGMPNTVLEAMAMEVPVVSTNVGGVPEIIIDTSMGLLAPVGDEKTLSENLFRLLKDEDARRLIGKAGRRRIVEGFSFAKRVRAMERYYEKLV